MFFDSSKRSQNAKEIVQVWCHKEQRAHPSILWHHVLQRNEVLVAEENSFTLERELYMLELIFSGLGQRDGPPLHALIGGSFLN
jgi:hypothetical protein